MNLHRYLSERLAILEQRNKTETSYERLMEVKGALAELASLLTFVNSQPEPDFLSQALNEGDGVYRP